MIGNINSIETMGLLDGPGIRVVVFLQGCPLRCHFCHNPETWSDKQNENWTAEELVKYILKYKEYFKDQGGVTFSGGEPLHQSKFLLECLKLCKKNNIHTCLDTSGVGTNYEEILDYTDLVIYDIKALDSELYRKLTGVDIRYSVNFLNTCLRKNKTLWIRQVIMPNYNDTITYIKELGQFIKPLKNVEKIELLPYHTLGVNKYKTLNIPYVLEGVPPMDKEKCDKLETILKDLT